VYQTPTDTYNTLKTKADFEAIFTQHYAHLCAYAFNFLKDQDAAEEVVQEVLFKLWTERDKLTISSSLKSYLFRAVRNTALNQLKHINIQEEYKKYNKDSRGAELSVEDQVMASELEVKIRQAIDQLPIERKKIFLLSRYEDLKYKEIAKKLNISVSTVENQMVKALRFLREELRDYLPWLIIFFGDFFRNS